jgi:hypothetical protein
MKSTLPWPRGYFAIGVEDISKPVNLGNLLRSAHAFGASFVFTIGADPRALEMRSDTSGAEAHVPLYHWRDLTELALPKGCSLVGVEMLDEATDLPSFPHPLRAAYVLGPERGALTPELAARCQLSCASPPPSPSMSRPPAQSSCTTDCALSAASAPAPWPQEPRPSPRGPTSRAAQSACAGLTAPSRQRKIEAICFGPAQESGTGICAGPFELLASSGH